MSSVQHRVMREEDRGSKPRGLGKERKRRPQHNPQSWLPSEHRRHGAARLAQVKQVIHTRYGGVGVGPELHTFPTKSNRVPILVQ